MSAAPSETGRGAAGTLPSALAQLHDLLLEATGLDGLLTATAELVVSLTHPRTVCAIRFAGDEASQLVGASCSRAAQAHHLELVHGEGPCGDAFHGGSVLYVEDLTQDDRWPLLGQALLRKGVTCVLAVPLRAEARTVGVLVLYAARAGHLARREVRDVLVLGQAAAAALVVRHLVDEQAQINEQLRQAVATRPLIDQALGIVMAQRRCTASQAFEVLRHASQSVNQPVRDLAAQIVATTTGRPPDAARPFVERTPEAVLG
jgi:GAF domain-containing protein